MGERGESGGLQVPKLSHEVGCMLLAKLKGQGAASAALTRAGRRLAEFEPAWVGLNFR